MEYISRIIKKWKEESGVSGVIQFKYSHSTGVLTIYTAYIGYLIGKAGCHYDKYKGIFKTEIHDFKGIEFIETDFYAV